MLHPTIRKPRLNFIDQPSRQRISVVHDWNSLASWWIRGVKVNEIQRKIVDLKMRFYFNNIQMCLLHLTERKFHLKFIDQPSANEFQSYDWNSLADGWSMNFTWSFLVLRLNTLSCALITLSSHLVGRTDKKLIYGPGDIEGHLGQDGRFYLVDFARYMPPEPPTEKGSILYRLVRPELVRRFGKSLSPDAFSLIGKDNNAVHNAEVREAYEYMRNVMIKDCGTRITESTNIKVMLHEQGINLR